MPSNEENGDTVNPGVVRGASVSPPIGGYLKLTQPLKHMSVRELAQL